MSHHAADDGLPDSARLAWWGTAWLQGRIGPDDVVDALLSPGDVPPLVLGDDPDDGPSPILLELAASRSAGATAVAASFPATGDPVGLRGPRALSAAAIEAGQCVLLLGAERALVPARVGRVVEWTPMPAARRPPLDLGEADRELRATLLTAADALAALDVARWRPEVADELMDLRSATPLEAPPGVPARCVDLAGRALRLWSVVDLALEDDGAAVSAGEAAARRGALEPLERAVRRALTAACSPDAWPPAE